MGPLEQKRAHNDTRIIDFIVIFNEESNR